MIQSNYKNRFTFDDIKSDTGLKVALEKGAQAVISEITDSKLRGCGGAGFSTGMKLKFTAEAFGNPKYVVCNADEGEPGTFKDRELFTNYADFVLAGMTIAGTAINAAEGILYLRGEYEYLVEHLEKVLETRRKNNLLGKDIMGRKGVGFEIKIRLGAGAYVCGEETALLESLEGYRGEPRNRPPFPVTAGYSGKPTCLSNVETFARIAAIMAKGAAWFKAVGTEKSAGYKLFSISGDCEKPGVYELPMGTTIAAMLKVVGAKNTQAVQCGGASGRCLHKNEFNRKIAFEDAPPGGAIIVFGEDRDMLEVAENFLEFFVEESCGQCTPCREGNVKLLAGIKLLRNKKCSPAYLEELVALCETMKIASKCGLGQASPNAFLDIIKNFSSEIFMGSN